MAKPGKGVNKTRAAKMDGLGKAIGTRRDNIARGQTMGVGVSAYKAGQALKRRKAANRAAAELSD